MFMKSITKLIVSIELAGKKVKVGLELGRTFEVKNAKRIIEEVESVIKNWKSYGKANNISSSSIKMIESVLKN